MKKKLLLLFVLFLFQISYGQIAYTANVIDSDKNPISGCEVRNTITGLATFTNAVGEFTITCSVNDVVVLSSPNYQIETITIAQKPSPIIVLNPQTKSALAPEDVTISPKNYWVGARVGYNLISNAAEDNFIGSATAGLNLYKFEQPNRNSISVIGNLGNYKFNTEEEDISEVQKLAQSVNGISIGLGYTFSDKLLDHLDHLNYNLFATARGRFTTFKNIGTAKESINFTQFVATLGGEIALANFEKEGELTLTISGSAYLFDKNQYNLIFGSVKDNICTADITLIVPLSGQIGFFASGTYAHEMSALYSFGIIIK